MFVPHSWGHFISECQKRHNLDPAAHELRFRKVGIQHLTLKYRIDFGITLAYYHRHARLDDSRLFKGDFRQRVAENIAVVKSDVCNHRKHRSHDVRTVETSAKTGLDHGDINTLRSEPLEGHHSRNFEERQVKMVERIMPTLAEIPYEIL